MSHITSLLLGIGLQALTVLHVLFIAGSQLMSGNLFFDTTNNPNPKVLVDTTTIETLSGALTSSITFARPLAFTTNGAQSGAIIKQDARVLEFMRSVACTATGGLAKYDTCIMPSPLSMTGSISTLSLDCGNTSLSVSVSGSFVKTRGASATATSFTNFSTKTIGSGSHVVFSTGSILWNPVDFIKMQASRTSIPNGTTPFRCVMRARGYQSNGL